MIGAAGEIVDLVEIVLKVVQLPLLRLFPKLNQLPSRGADAAILADAVVGIREFVVLVEKRITPRRRFSFQKRDEAAALHGRRDRNAGDLEKRRRDVEIQNHVLAVDGAGGRMAGIANQKRYSNRWLVHQSLVKQAVLAHEEAVVGGEYDDGVFREIVFVEELEHVADVLIDA